MAKLTDTQLIVLSKAAARDEGLALVPAKMNKAAASKVGSSLVARKLMRELKAKPGMPVWRENEDGRGISLMITRAGAMRSPPGTSGTCWNCTGTRPTNGMPGTSTPSTAATSSA